ncbi:helix-turn-helix domain-containing protein [Methylobacterium sp. J-068]|uniref:helix-turn-helix domain-containing protein n=1 Tax=Methylobacterium sp. J-068 TaxID=2836649 RepID=UPI001FBB84C4|nr:helix-turn-helix domain-containing protein [Methylobacterium sp. J-068]MCJ2033518.1 helix-turn-helix domain-containing protein [Methylobacterium sp. J-068]
MGRVCQGAHGCIHPGSFERGGVGATAGKDWSRIRVQTLFSTAGLDEPVRFPKWREFLDDRIGPVDQRYIGEGPFDGLIEASDVGGLRVTRIAEASLRTCVTPETLRRRDEPDVLFALIQLAGQSITVQDGREAIQRAGDVVVLGGRPNVHVSSQRDQSFVIELPAERLEGLLGSSRLYTALTFEAAKPATAMFTTYFQELMRLRDRLAPDTAARVASIGVDLLVAGIAERLAQEVPGPLNGTVVVQRAKAHVEARLGDASLDPQQVAAAAGVSLRRLQELFRERGRNIDAWIWQRRLETSARRLADPGSRHLTIETLAYGCGFASPAHFSRRFKDRYGMTPREYREVTHHPPA